MVPLLQSPVRPWTANSELPVNLKMPETKTAVITIQLGSHKRWLLLLPVLLALLGAWFAVRWFVGNTIAEYAPGVNEGGLEMARMAVRWAPGDPLTHWRLGTMDEKSFSAQNLAATVSDYQQAVSLSPNDYRYWTELGRALEASGDSAGGEKALRRAVELAPAYSHPRWYLGNLLLREGNYEQAFNELARAGEADGQMRPQVFDLAMRLSNGDSNQAARLACPSVNSRLNFAIYLVGAKKFNDAVRLWSTIPAADRQAKPELVATMEQSLLLAKEFRSALAVMRLDRESDNQPVSEQIWNGGFESPVTGATGTNGFGWIVKTSPQVQVDIAPPGRSGQASLRVVFKSPKNLDTIQASQIVAVEPGAQYRLDVYARTQGLVSASPPVLIVSDAVDGNVLATSKPLNTDASDWQQLTLTFNSNSQHDGIIVTFARPACEDTEFCPIFGTVWYDDFNLQRISSPGSTARIAASNKS
jgi:Carbohydrate binding domain/Tetratricopeptide repeat